MLSYLILGCGIFFNNLFPYKFPTDEDKEALFKKAKPTVSVDANPRYIFKEILRFIIDHKIVFPAYLSIQKLISKAIIAAENELFSNLKNLNRQRFNSILYCIVYSVKVLY